jgi:hypothetical protein
MRIIKQISNDKYNIIYRVNDAEELYEILLYYNKDKKIDHQMYHLESDSRMYYNYIVDLFMPGNVDNYIKPHGIGHRYIDV